ncbi:MAG: RHS domain-containing protein, partial [Proteobacteria bacterium]|nr:RHS domain-containing protein [Pseudomonadota bacterium]
MDQRYDGGRWNLLGEFTLQPGQNHRVVVSDDAQAWVFADAVRFQRVGSARLVQADAVKIVPNTAEDALYVHTDHLGTPRKMTDDSRAVVWDAEYRPFGEADSITGTAANDNRFPGQSFDAETGLHYNYFRDYDPTLGRYIQSDPIGLAGGLNTYGYVGGNPVNAVDPEGLESLLGGGGIGANPDNATPGDTAFALGMTLAPLALAAPQAAAAFCGLVRRAITRGLGDDIIDVVTRTTRTGKPGVRVTRGDGRVKDITQERVKEFVREPLAKKGLKPLKFKDSLPGSKGKKRAPNAGRGGVSEEFERPLKTMNADQAVRNYRCFLDASWPFVNMLNKEEPGREALWDDWAQANWEFLVESRVCMEANQFLEVYGDGADSYGSSGLRLT